MLDLSDLPDLADLPPGCSFAPRCSYVIERCNERVPDLSPTGPAHAARCILARPDGDEHWRPQ